MPTRPLPDQVALVTGASRGIGAAVAGAFADEGLRVVIVGRDAAAIEATRSVIAARHPGRVAGVAADVRVPADVDRAAATAVEQFGGLDVVVNNAGVGAFAPIAEMTLEQWAAVIDTNLTGVFLTCRAAIPHLRRRGGGYIINVSSLAGANPFTGGGVYCASKAGLDAFTQVLMQELRFDDIRVSSVAPGSVHTGFMGRDATVNAGWKLQSEDVAEVIVNLLRHDPRCLPSRVEVRPSKPRKS